MKSRAELLHCQQRQHKNRLNGPVAECLRLAAGPAKKCFSTKKVHVKMI